VQLDPVEILCQLVATSSVNPMGGHDTDAPFLETRLTDHLERLAARLGLRVERQRLAGNRENLIARLDGSIPPERGGPVVLFDAHQDTVPVEGMTIDPFTPEVREGRLYGRGSCDTKGGMAAMLTALARLAELRPASRPTVLMCCTVDEEHGFSGARALTELWTGRQGGIIPRRPDAAVIAEPTDLNVVLAHKGVVRWKCHTVGRACHSARPEARENAIYRMAEALVAIQRYARQVVAGTRFHPLCGGATLSVGTIHGGTSVNTVPDRCTIEIDRRLPPGESPEEARRELVEYLRRATEPAFSVQHDPPSMQGPALSDEFNGLLAEELVQAARAVTGGCRKVGVAYATNAAFYSATGVPSVVFGPGRLEQAHTNDEWLPLDQLHQAAEIYYRFVRNA